MSSQSNHRISAVLIASLLPFILASPSLAQRVRQLTDIDRFEIADYVLDDAGSQAWFVSDIDPLGNNPRVIKQVFRIALPGGSVEQLTAFDSDIEELSVADDGLTLLFRSSADPLGTNSDHSIELFVSDENGGSIVQLTDDQGTGIPVISARVSGGGDRAVFVTATLADPDWQVYVIGTDGSGKAKLTQGAGDWVTSARISDDGQRIVFLGTRDLTTQNPDGSVEVFRVLADGTGLAQVTGDAAASALEIAGSGNRIVYVDGTSGQGLTTIPYEGGSAIQIDTASVTPTITDSGQFIYYFGGPNTIWKFDVVTLGRTAIWTTEKPRQPAVAGGGERLLFQTTEFTVDLLATDGDGGSDEQIASAGEAARVLEFDLSADGRWLAYRAGDLYVSDTDSGATTRLTHQARIFMPAISEDGNTIAFTSQTELIPSTCTLGWAYRIAADGSGLAELDVQSCPQVLDYPVVSNDASTIVLMVDGSELYRLPGGGGIGSLILDDSAAVNKNPRVDGSGSWVVYTSTGNPTGQNADGGFEVFRVRTDGSGLEQITAAPDPSLASFSPDVSSDGSKVVYASYSDPLGTNTDHNQEVFLHDTSTDVTQQLTETTTGLNKTPRISPSGGYVAFYTTSAEFGPQDEVYRLNLADGTIGLASAGIGWADDWQRFLDVDNEGRVAFWGAGDLLGQNPDQSEEIWLAEFDVEPSFVVGSTRPTLLTWDASPSFVSYDVIRGSLDALRAGPAGTIDLGPVVCIENDSPDASTFGDEDFAEPESNRGFFYLYRGNPSGSWGSGSGQAERISEGGACLD